MPKVLTFGKAYRIRKGSKHIGLALPVRGKMRLVRWSNGRRITCDWCDAQAIVEEPGVYKLLRLWGVEVEVLNAFVESHVYARNDDVRKVRSTPERRVGCQ